MQYAWRSIERNSIKFALSFERKIAPIDSYAD